MISINLPAPFWTFLKILDRTIARSCIWLIVHLRPLLGPEKICPFTVGCTQYALITLQNFHTPYSFYLIAKRLLMCNPLWLTWKAAGHR